MEITEEQIQWLSRQTEGLMELQLGQVLPFIGIFFTPDGKMAIYTNRKDNRELSLILLEAARIVMEREVNFKDLPK